jgi:long-chain acyl-CoA synthetase
MSELISLEALESLWREKLKRLAPRLNHETGDLLKQDFTNDLRLDSLEILELYSSFTDLFGIQLLAETKTHLYQYTNGEDCIKAILLHLEKASHLTFKSSGSTADPKTYLHSISQLNREVAFWSELWAGTSTIYYCTNGMHIYGFIMGALLPSRLKVSAHCFKLLDWTSIAEEIPKNTLIIAFPEAIEHLPEQLRFPQGCKIVSSTAPLSRVLESKVLASGLELFKVYGSTETAGIAYSKNQSRAYQLLPYWSSIDDSLYNSLSGTMHALSDELTWQSERNFILGGRVDEVIQIAGHNISLPEIIGSIKLAFPNLIEEIWLRKMNPSEGKRLKAWVQIQDINSLDQQDKAAIYNWVEDNLPIEARPKHLTFSGDKTLSAFGKLKDWPIYD